MNKNISPEQIKIFKHIQDNILHRYNRAKKYAEIFSGDSIHSTSGPAYIATTEALEPLAEIAGRMDLSKSYDADELKKFARQFQETMDALPDLQQRLESVNFAFDDVFEDLNILENTTNQFLSELDLESEQTFDTQKGQVAEQKEPEKKEQVKEPEPKQPEPKVEQPEKKQEEKIVSTPSAPHKPDLQKEQKKEDVAKEPLDAMKREDAVHTKEDAAEAKKEEPQKQKSHRAAIEKLQQIVDMFDRNNSDESYKKMMFALKEVADNKLVPDEMIDTYRYMFNEVKQHKNTERGILDLSAELYNQIEELKSMDGQAQERTVETKGRAPDKQKDLENFTNGTRIVQQMDEQREEQRRLALIEAYKKRLQEGRKQGV